MKLLILGGTVFLGRHLVERALACGHQVTLFNRGVQNPDLFPEVEKLRGDRDGDMSALHGRQFDCVIDTCGYEAAQMHATVAALGARGGSRGGSQVGYYLFVSSISAYGTFAPGQHFDESHALATGDADYGARKARCEEIAIAAWPGQVAIVRPGLIVGPHDVSGRFGYWPLRVAQGGRVLAPGQPHNPVQWIDVRDLANWCLHLCEKSICGQFNAVGPAQVTGFGDLLERCRAVAQSEAELVWIDDATLLANDVAPWTELPLWLAQNDPEFGGMQYGKPDHALAHGLKLRALDDTLRDTLVWERTQLQANHPRRVKSMTPEREAQLLAKATTHFLSAQD
jgi:2'-hydroxyisoflavone reductase